MNAVAGLCDEQVGRSDNHEPLAGPTTRPLTLPPGP
jgi:hypothetical protein